MLNKPLELAIGMERPQVRGPPGVSRSDRRKRARSHVHWPVCFFGGGVGRTVETTTENLSSSGFLCFSPVPLNPGDLMICVLGIPSHQHVHSGRALSLECKVRVLRVEPAH